MEQLENYQTEYQLLGEDGFEVGWLDEQEAVLRSGSPVLAGGLAYLSGAQFQSGKFLLRLACGLARLSKVSLCDGGRAEKIEPAGSALRLDTPAGVINSEQVFLAIHALTPPLMPPPEKGLRAQRGQVFVTVPLPERPCTGGFGTTMASWRDIPEPDGRFRMLFGGGRDRNRPETLQDSLFPHLRLMASLIPACNMKAPALPPNNPSAL